MNDKSEFDAPYIIIEKRPPPPEPPEGPPSRTFCESCGDVTNSPHGFVCRLMTGKLFERFRKRHT
jgi:hypothetical protein